jgi:hypothetical protein
MSELIIKLAKGEPVTDADIEYGLYEICDRVHSSCDYECPVYDLNGGKTVNGDRPFEENRGCDCFKSGKAMLAFIREKTAKKGRRR